MSSSLSMAYAARKAAGSPTSTSITKSEHPDTTDLVSKIMARRSKAKEEPIDELTEDDMDLVTEQPEEDPILDRRALIASIVGRNRD